MTALRLALVARDIQNSVTPMAYQMYGESLGRRVEFQLCNVEPETFPNTLEYGRAHWNGFTVTMPYKKRMMDYADRLDPSAEACGSINTVLVQDGSFVGYNTDGWGFVRHLALQGVKLAGKVVTMVGAGGVALSIAYQLTRQGAAQVRVLNILQGEGEALCAKFGCAFSMLTAENLTTACQGADLFVNASVLGQIGYPDYESFDFLSALPSEAVVYDVNYSKGDSALLLHARHRGLAAYNGSAMSICQGIRAMEIWTGTPPTDETAQRIIARRQALQAIR